MMQTTVAEYNLNNKNVLILRGDDHIQDYALKYGVCICKNEIKVVPCKYISLYEDGALRYLYEITKHPVDDATRINTPELSDILRIEGSKAIDWFNKYEPCRLFWVKKVAELSPVVNDFISPKTHVLTPFTCGTPRYTIVDRIKKAKLTSELECTFEDDCPPPVDAPVVEVVKPKPSKWPYYAIPAFVILLSVALYFVFKPSPPPKPEVKIEKPKPEPPKLITFGDNTFESGSSILSAESVPSLQQALTILKDYPELKIKIVGYTDNTGLEKKNKKISEARAKAVRDWFIKYKVDPTRMEFIGMGRDNPIAPNTSPEGRKKNRRTEIIIYK